MIKASKKRSFKISYATIFMLAVFVAGTFTQSASAAISTATLENPLDSPKTSRYKSANNAPFKAKINVVCSPYQTNPGDNSFAATLPEIVDEQRFAKAIDDWIQKNQPNSPLNGMGIHAVNSGKRSGINPILPIIIAKMETQLGTTQNGSGIAEGSNNSYGRMAANGQPSVGKWYKWDSWEASLNSADDMYAYVARVYANEIKISITSVMMKYAPPHENNTTQYIQNINQWAQEIYTLAGDAVVGTPTEGSDPGTPDTPPATGGQSNGRIVYDFLLSKGLTQTQALGMIGNLMAESGGQTTALNPAAVNPNSGAYGIVQWLGTRKDPDLKNFADANAKTMDNLSLQMDFMWHELTGKYRESTLDPLKNVTGSDEASLKEAVRIVLVNYEAPGNQAQELINRLGFAKKAQIEFGSSAAPVPADCATPLNQTGPIVSGDDQQLAKKLLECNSKGNISIRDSAWKSGGVSPLQQIVNISEGKPAIPGYQYTLHTTILKIEANLCQKYKYAQGSFLRTENTVVNGVSAHTLGLAADIGSIGSNELSYLDNGFKQFMLDAEAIIKADGIKCSFGVDPPLVASVRQFITYCTVFADAGTGPHLHIGLDKSLAKKAPSL